MGKHKPNESGQSSAEDNVPRTGDQLEAGPEIIAMREITSLTAFCRKLAEKKGEHRPYADDYWPSFDRHDDVDEFRFKEWTPVSLGTDKEVSFAEFLDEIAKLNSADALPAVRALLQSIREADFRVDPENAIERKLGIKLSDIERPIAQRCFIAHARPENVEAFFDSELASYIDAPTIQAAIDTCPSNALRGVLLALLAAQKISPAQLLVNQKIANLLDENEKQDLVAKYTGLTATRAKAILDAQEQEAADEGVEWDITSRQKMLTAIENGDASAIDLFREQCKEDRVLRGSLDACIAARARMMESQPEAGHQKITTKDSHPSAKNKARYMHELINRHDPAEANPYLRKKGVRNPLPDLSFIIALVQARYPQFVGMSLFGSLGKGYWNGRDIDMASLFNHEEAAKRADVSTIEDKALDEVQTLWTSAGYTHTLDIRRFGGENFFHPRFIGNEHQYADLRNEWLLEQTEDSWERTRDTIAFGRTIWNDDGDIPLHQFGDFNYHHRFGLSSEEANYVGAARRLLWTPPDYQTLMRALHLHQRK